MFHTHFVYKKVILYRATIINVILNSYVVLCVFLFESHGVGVYANSPCVQLWEGFKLAKHRQQGWNVVGQRATVQVSGRGGGGQWIWITSQCATTCNDGVLSRRPVICSTNTEHLILLLDELYRILVPEDASANSSVIVVVWDNVAFQHFTAVTVWFTARIQGLPHCFYHHTYPSLTPLRNSFLHVGGRFMTSIHMITCHF